MVFLLKHKGDIMTAVIEQIVELAQRDAPRGVMITANTTIDEIGFDSLDVLNLVVAIEDRFNIEINVAERLCCSTLGEIAALVDRRLEPVLRAA